MPQKSAVPSVSIDLSKLLHDIAREMDASRDNMSIDLSKLNEEKWKLTQLVSKQPEPPVDEIDDATRQRLVEWMKGQDPTQLKEERPIKHSHDWNALPIDFGCVACDGCSAELTVALWARAKAGEFSQPKEHPWRRWTIEELRALPVGTRVEHKRHGVGKIGVDDDGVLKLIGEKERLQKLWLDRDYSWMSEEEMRLCA